MSAMPARSVSMAVTAPDREEARARAVAAAMDIVAEQGLAALSVRDLAAAIGKSTTVIFNLFQTKAGVVAAMVEAAMVEDAAFHDAFLSRVDGLALDQRRVVDITARYVLARAASGSISTSSQIRAKRAPGSAPSWPATRGWRG